MPDFDLYAIADDLIREVGDKPLKGIDLVSLAQRHHLNDTDPVVEVGRWCVKNGYMIENSKTDMNYQVWWGKLTALGLTVANGGGTTRPQTREPNSSTNYNFNGPVNAGQVGSGNTQQITMTISQEQIHELAHSLRRDGHNAEAERLLEATDNGKQPGKVLETLKELGPALSGYGSFLTAILGIVAG